MPELLKRFAWLEAASPATAQENSLNKPLNTPVNNPLKTLLVNTVSSMSSNSNTDLQEMIKDSCCSAVLGHALPRPGLTATTAIRTEGADASPQPAGRNCGVPTPWNELSTLLWPGLPPAANAMEVLTTAGVAELIAGSGAP